METLKLKNHNDTFLYKLIVYENEIFNKFIQNRTNLIKSLEELDTTTLNNEQLKNMMYDFKVITDTLKNANENISDFISNQKTHFKNNNSVCFNSFVTHYFLFKNLFYESEESEESEESSDKSEESEESESLPSDSDSEP